MALTVDQAREMQESGNDVFIPNGDAGAILSVSRRRGVWGAWVRVDSTATRYFSEAWYPLTELDNAKTLNTPVPCQACVYGEPADHTCDSDQERKHAMLMRDERDV